jgi:hypothetical protein
MTDPSASDLLLGVGRTPHNPLNTERVEEGEVSAEPVEPLESPPVYAWLVGVCQYAGGHIA